MVVLAVVFLSGLSACSFSESSKSSSKILSSPFESISNSSNSSSPGDKYVADVRDYTSGYLTSGGDGSKLEQEISTVAGRHGVSDWESNARTYKGLGQGLHKAGATQAQLDGYKRTIADNEEQAAWMQQGYDDYDPED